MKKYKISYGKIYQDKQGQEKTSWKPLGYGNEIISQEGKTTIHCEMDSIPPNWDGSFKLFLQDEQQQGGQAPQQREPQGQPEYRYEDSQGREQQPPQQSYRR